MAINEPIDPLVRLAISQWPDDAPGEFRRSAPSTPSPVSRSTSCANVRKPTDRPRCSNPRPDDRSRAPRSSAKRSRTRPSAVRAALEASGLDHGPISVHDKMHSMGLEQVPSTASLARIFREAGVARLEPKKKPRSAWRRFVYPAPNACWQLDATEYVLTGGRTCVIFQLIDDHSRYAVASHVAFRETAKEAIAVVVKAIAAHGVPQRLLSDNGIALNPSRRGYVGQLVTHVACPRRGGDHRQALQTDHPGQERTLPPDPVPLPRQAADRRVAGRTPSPGRRVRPHLQHRAPPPRTARAHHTADRMGSDPEGRSTPTETRPARLRPCPSRAATGPRAAAAHRSPHQHPCQNPEHRRDLQSRLSHLPGRCATRAFKQVLIVTQRRQDHHHRSPGRDPHRAHPTRTRNPPMSATADPAAHTPRTTQTSPKS